VQIASERVSHEKGKRPLPVWTPNEVLQVKRRRLQCRDPAVLQRQVWRHFDQLFGSFTQVQSKELKWGDVSLEKDATGNERLERYMQLKNKSKVRDFTSSQSRHQSMPNNDLQRIKSPAERYEQPRLPILLGSKTENKTWKHSVVFEKTTGSRQNWLRPGHL